MKQQIIYIGGGVAKENFPSLATYVRNISYNPYENFTKNWSDNLQIDLGDDFEVIKIPMPNKWFAEYEIWEIMFEKIFEYLHDDTIFVCNSLGCSFLLKYFSLGKKIPHKISKIFFIAPPLHDSKEEVLGTFNFSLLDARDNLLQEKYQIFIYHSRDDHIVPFSDSQELFSYFPDATFREFSDKGHFFLEAELPEILIDIKT